jgi:hypothetical protein
VGLGGAVIYGWNAGTVHVLLLLFPYHCIASFLRLPLQLTQDRDRIIYILAAIQHNRSFIFASIAGHALAAWIFWPYGGVWRNVAVFEAGCGGVLGVAMGWESWRGRESKGRGKTE